jgi:hypothetical protein
MKRTFREVIKKHKLKFRLEEAFRQTYDPEKRLNYAFFVQLCKTNNVHIAVFLGPPPESYLGREEIVEPLKEAMNQEGISFQFLPFQELNRAYCYLNLALDITLARKSGLFE